MNQKGEPSNDPDISREAESAAAAQREPKAAGARPRPKLRHPRQLYLFPQVEGVIAAKGDAVRVVLTTGNNGDRAETELDLGPGDWILVRVAGAEGFDRAGLRPIPNPFDAGDDAAEPEAA